MSCIGFYKLSYLSIHTTKWQYQMPLKRKIVKIVLYGPFKKNEVKCKKKYKKRLNSILSVYY